MAERYHRAQLLLEPEQHDRMRHIARREDRSISAVAREVIGIGLSVLAKDEQARAERRELALAQLHEIREGAQARYGEYQGDLVDEVRSDRSRRLDAVRKQDD
ncbi:MAG: hypothetical protein R3191_00015 [Anaerolineales bacterium]|nr:hypothetical protein [Anaerolineales bacterium]